MTIHGGPLALADAEPRSLAPRLAARVAAMPHGVVRSYRGDGTDPARSHAALWRDAGDVAAALAAAGMAPGGFVVVLADDILNFLPAAWGCLRGGFVPVALMGAARDALHHGDGGFARLAALLGTPAILADDGFAPRLATVPGLRAGPVLPLSGIVPAEWRHDHPGTPGPAWLVATSGTTGGLKLVALSRDALLHRKFAGTHGGLPAPPNALGVFPLDGMTGQDAAFLHHESWTQVSSRLMALRPATVLDAIEEHGIAEVVLTTSMIRAILAAEAGSGRTRRLGSLRVVALGAEPVGAGVVQAFAGLLRRHGADPGVLVAGYGATETGALVGGSRAVLSGDGSRPACLGPPGRGVSLRIRAEGGGLAGDGEAGEVEVWCPAKMFSGYWAEPELTAAAFTADGWWRTGDLGWLVGGELTVSGRAKEVLIRNGRKLVLAEIDAVLATVLQFGAVAHAFRMDAGASGEEALGVALDPGPGLSWAEAEAAVRTATLRRFGLAPGRVAAVPADQVPRTEAGKVRRGRLAALAVAAPAATPRPAAAGAPGDDVAERLGAVWRDVLGLDRPARPDDRFFDGPGDSLRAVELELRVAEVFGVRVTGEAFLADPSFGGLLRLVRQGMALSAVPPDEAGWPLPPWLRQGLDAALAAWPGARAWEGSVIAGHNVAGPLPPLLWVFNVPHEAPSLAQALGPAQPLYAARSGYRLIDYSEDEVQLLALRYVTEIERLRPTGPVFVGGNCQGGIVALAAAQHLLRRGRHVPLLVLLDWSYPLPPYSGRVLMVGCADSVHLNPRRLFARPEMAWSRLLGACRFVEIPGGYAEGLLPPQVGVLAGVLDAHMRAALAQPALPMPASGYRADVEAGVPVRLRVRERRRVRVRVTNRSDVAWAPTARSGLVLGARWVRPDDEPQGPPQPRAALPALAPGASAVVLLRLVAPAVPGAFTLVLDVLEEGSRWFGQEDGGARWKLCVVARSGWWAGSAARR